MKALLSIALFAALVLGVASPASAVIIVDDFTQTPQAVSAPSGGNPAFDEQTFPAAGGVGTTRFVWVQRNSGTGSVSIETLNPDPQGDFQAVTTATGDFQIGYDGTDDDSFTPNAGGVGLNIDATGNDGLSLFASSDTGIDLIVTLYNGATAFSTTLTIASGGGPLVEYFALFTSFAGLDISDIDAINIASSTTAEFGRDVSLSLLTFKAVPEPASMILLAVGGVGCAGGAWRRRRKLAAKG